ncbi:MAG: FAD:protein FMN transferase [Gemmiger sp.]|nr:FAD:protein FMN transferase [Gemmiger sp.]
MTESHHPQKKWLPLAGLVAGCLLLVALLWRPGGGLAPTPTPYQTTFWDVFDTVTTVTGYADSQPEWDAQMDALHADLQRYHRLFDIYNAYPGLNNLYTINQNAGKGPVAVEEDILSLLTLAKEMYTQTGGKCNVAAGAVLALWHDARAAAEADPAAAALPDAKALQLAAAHTDPQNLLLDTAAGTVALADPALQLDVGSMAKGWATEMAARAAQARGLASALLNVGGNLRAIGQKPDGTAWTAGVETPWPNADGSYSLATPVVRVALQSGQSLVVSGDYQRYYTVDGKNYSHLIDPATLYPATFVSSVAVLCADSGVADALSTGLFCTDVADGLALVESLPGVEAIWLAADHTQTTSSGFAALETGG